MSDSQHSPLWYRVAGLRPRLRSHTDFHRHSYRGHLWYVLQDPNTGRCHRIAPEAYRIAGLMDGERTTQEIWELANEQLGDDAPTQDETIRLLGLLHAADVLRADVSPDTEELLRRSRRREDQEWWQRLLHPLSLRIPLLDPDAFLTRHVAWARPIFTPAGAAVWALVVASAGLLALAHASELRESATHELLDPRNLLVVALVYPFVKALHELGHGFASKVWGGQVREMGVMFLVFVPVPYVDASSSSAFPEKHRRMAVAAAGIAVELFIAAIALLLWVVTEPSLIRTAAYNVLLISGLSTLLFNGNPLLKFDGYYMLCDALEIPNLAPRAQQYLGYLVMHHAFGMEQVRYPVQEPGERPWLIAYGVAAFVYRLILVFTIALLVAGRFFVVGVFLAIASVVVQILVPVVRHGGFLLRSPRLGGRRARALGISGGVVAALALALLVLPVPLLTAAEGVVWPAADAEVRAGSDGFVGELLVAPGSAVEPGAPLIRLTDRAQETELRVLEARRSELAAQRHAEVGTNRVRANMTAEELTTATAGVARARQKAAERIVRSAASGRFVVPEGDALVGRFVHQGDLLGYVVGPSIRTVRVVMPQADAALVREDARGVEIRLSRDLATVWPARIARQVPGATRRLPHAALGSLGGGRLAVTPEDENGLATLDTVFELDLELPAEAGAQEIGGRAYVRFHHAAEPLALRLERGLLRLLMRHFGV